MILLLLLLYISIGIILTVRAYFKVPLRIKHWELLDRLVVCVGMAIMWLPLLVRDAYILYKERRREK